MSKPTKGAESAKPETAAAPKAAETAAIPAASEQKAAISVEKPAEKSKKVKVKFLRSHPEYGYFGGEEGEISQEAFDRISKDGAFFEKI